METKNDEKNHNPSESVEQHKILRKDVLKLAQLPYGASPNDVPLKEYGDEEAYQEEWKKATELYQDEWRKEKEAELMKRDEERLMKRSENREDWSLAISIEELCKKEFPPMRWVVENLFAKGTINQISAPPNQGKTWLVLHIAACIASGELVFGEFVTEKQGVLVVNEEDPEYMLQERFLKLLDVTASMPLYIHAEKGIKIAEKTDELLEEMRERNLQVIIFDSLSVIHTADENSAQAMGEVFEQMKRFTREGCTVIFTNHHRKKSRHPGLRDDLQEQTRGSTVINAVPAGHITCEEKKEGDTTLIIMRQAKLKGAKKIDPFLVEMVEDMGKIRFVYKGEYLEDADAAAKLRNKLYEILEKSEKWLGIPELKEAVGMSSDKAIRLQLTALATTGQIRRETRSELRKQGAFVVEREKARGNEILYFKIAAEEPTEYEEADGKLGIPI